MSLTYKKGNPEVRKGIYRTFSTDDTETPASIERRVGVVLQSDWGDVDDVTIINSKEELKEKFGNGFTTGLVEKVFLGAANEDLIPSVYAIRLSGEGAKKATTKIKATAPVKVINLTKGTEKAGTAVETADATFSFSKNQLTVTFSNVPEGYKPSVRVKGQVGILGFLPGKFYDTELSNGTKHIITYNPGAPINGEMTIEACLTKDKIQVLKSCTYTCAEAEEDKEFTIPLELKYPGDKKLNLQIKQDLKNEDIKLLSILEDGEVVESLEFVTAEDENEIENLKQALEDSKFINGTGYPEEELTTSTVQETASQSFSGGANPVITNQSYSDAFEVLEKYRFTTLAIDTVESDVKEMAVEYVNQLYENGRYVILTLGTDSRTTLSELLKEAASYNNRNVVLVGPGYIDADNKKVEEYELAGQVAGMIASYPSNRAITNKELTGAVKLIRGYSHEDYKRAVQGGLVTLSINELDQVVIENGNTTLINPEKGIEDLGWKKIKRTKTRNEIFYDIDIELAPYVADVTPDDDGAYFVIGLISNVLNRKVADKKIAPDYAINLTTEIQEPDSFSYEIVVYDYDSLEKIYLHYKFRYAQETA